MNEESLHRYFECLTKPDTEHAPTPCISASVLHGGTVSFFCAKAVSHDPVYRNFSGETMLHAGALTGFLYGILLSFLSADGLLTFGAPVGRFLPDVPQDHRTVGEVLTAGDNACLYRLIKSAAGYETERYFQTRLFAPLCMDHTFFWGSKPSHAQAILPYDRDTDTYGIPDEDGIFTTAHDLLLLAGDLQNVLHGRKHRGVFTKWQADFLLGHRSGAYCRNDGNASDLFPDFASPSACAVRSENGMLMIDPVYDISLVFLTNAVCFSRTPSLYARTAAVLYSACRETD